MAETFKAHAVQVTTTEFDEHNCNECKYSWVWDGANVCRRYPPQMTSKTHSTFPRIQAGSWTCGEFDKK